MVYLDYSATTPVKKEVLETFNKVSLNYIGNANSLHKLGLDSKKIMNKSTEIIKEVLKLDNHEVIFTSSATESNNMAIKGIINSYPNRGKHIITTKLEHSSVLETFNYLEKNGYEVSYVKINEDGSVNLDDLQNLTRKDTILVSICHVNSEVGIIQDINKINKVIKDKNPLCFFHVDGTQAIGKINVDIRDIDLYTFSAHKFYGLKGIATLIKKKNINITPLIHGGKSQTEYRSGTPTIALMASLSKALKLIYTDFDSKYNHVKKLNEQLITKLKNNENIVINSLSTSIPHIVNISIPGIKPETMLHYLEQNDIYISTKTACSKDNSDSLTLTTLNKDKSIASSSIRISISHLTTEEEIEIFTNILNKAIRELKF